MLVHLARNFCLSVVHVRKNTMDWSRIQDEQAIYRGYRLESYNVRSQHAAPLSKTRI